MNPSILSLSFTIYDFKMVAKIIKKSCSLYTFSRNFRNLQKKISNRRHWSCPPYSRETHDTKRHHDMFLTLPNWQANNTDPNTTLHVTGFSHLLSPAATSQSLKKSLTSYLFTGRTGFQNLSKKGTVCTNQSNKPVLLRTRGMITDEVSSCMYESRRRWLRL